MSHPEYAPAPYSERILTDRLSGKFHFVKSQDVTGILQAAHEMKDMVRKDTGPVQGRYLGTVPVLVAQQWAKDCGAAIGTKEWAAYAKKQLKDGTWSKLRVHG